MTRALARTSSALARPSKTSALLAAAGIASAALASVPQDAVILADVSASMADALRDGGTRIARLREALASVQGGTILPYAETLRAEVPRHRIDSLRADGCDTLYAPAIRGALARKASVILLISDGEAADGEDALGIAREARRRGVKVNTLFIGDSRAREAQELLKEIADLTGGTFQENVMQSAPALAAAISSSLLLTA